MELQGQVAIVTGAGRGIGRATALELARMGADIVVAELDRANAEGTASELRGLDRRALVVQTALAYPGYPRLPTAREVTSSNPLRAKVCAIIVGSVAWVAKKTALALIFMIASQCSSVTSSVVAAR